MRRRKLKGYHEMYVLIYQPTGEPLVDRTVNKNTPALFATRGAALFARARFFDTLNCQCILPPMSERHLNKYPDQPRHCILATHVGLKIRGELSIADVFMDDKEDF